MFQQTLDAIARLKKEIWLFPWKRRSRREMAEYLRNHRDDVRINIGSARDTLGGWLNVDVWPHPGTVFMDATNPLPFEDSSVRFIQCEQMIEHITYREGLAFLAECRRILAPGGVMRIITPNLRREAEVYLGLPDSRAEESANAKPTPTDDVLLEHHRTWHNRHDTANKCHWLNDHFRLWGHQFLYDEDTLLDSFRQAGFEKIVPVEFGESEHEELHDRDVHWENQEWIKSYFIMLFEATK